MLYFSAANFNIPKVGELFQDVNYSDIYGIAAEKIVRQYREDALGLPSYPQSNKRGRYDHRGGGGGGQRYGGHRGGGHSGYSSNHYGYVSYSCCLVCIIMISLHMFQV